jgi:hypothetical protein
LSAWHRYPAQVLAHGHQRVSTGLNYFVPLEQAQPRRASTAASHLFCEFMISLPA